MELYLMWNAFLLHLLLFQDLWFIYKKKKDFETNLLGIAPLQNVLISVSNTKNV